MSETHSQVALDNGLGRDTKSIGPRRSRSSVVIGAVWMVLVSLALFFLPVINGFVGGIVGGYKVGSVKRALIAAILPAIAVAVGLWLLLIAFELPLLGFLASLAVGLIILLADVGLFIGAAIGGAIGTPQVPEAR